MGTLELIVVSVLGIIILGLIVCIGAIPGHIAEKRNHPNAKAIDILGWLGWLFTGGILWIVALVWAISSFPPPSPAIPFDNSPTKKCPFCAELIKAEALVCRYCNRNVPSASEIKKKADAEADAAFSEAVLGVLPPTKWRIVGMKNGKTVTATATTKSAAEARQLAESKGIIVSKVTYTQPGRAPI